MEKIYVVTGETGKYEDVSTTIHYVGNNKNKAFNFDPNDDKYTHTLYIEVWANEKQIEGYYKHEGEEWQNNFSKIEELKKQIELSKNQLEKAEKELSELEKENK